MQCLIKQWKGQPYRDMLLEDAETILAVVKRLPVLHYSVIYLFWFFVITEHILGFLKNYIGVTNETLLAETS